MNDFDYDNWATKNRERVIQENVRINNEEQNKHGTIDSGGCVVLIALLTLPFSLFFGYVLFV